MRYNTFVLFTCICLVMVFPGSAAALSCLDPESSIEYYVEGEDTNFIIVTATPTERKEFVKEAAVGEDDPNSQFDSGYSAQFITIEEAHKGGSPDVAWVYFQKDATWNYLCTNEPPALETKNVYVLSQPTSLFDVTSVVAVYPVDSVLGTQLIEAAESAPAGPFDEVSEVFETDKNYWLQGLYDQLKEMAFYVEIKLAEWKYWLTQ